MAVDVGSAVAFLDLDTSGFKKGISTAMTQIRLLSDTSLSTETRLASLGSGLQTLGRSLSKSVTLPLSLASAGILKASVDFESAFTGVLKTVDGTAEQLEVIKEGILDLSTQTASSAVDIASVAEAAGQLGVATDDVLGFTKIMIELGDATNLTADEAATSLARFMNIMGTTNDKVENLGSTIVDLGNNFATTESEIVAMSTRLASSGKIVGLTEQEILALSTAMSSVGIQAEAGSTAMAQTLTDIEKAVATGSDKLKTFASVSGYSAREFADVWEEKPIVAIQAFLEGLGSLEEKSENATLILDDLGLTGIRQSNMLKSLGSASEILANAVGVANGAWENNIALSEEAEKRYGTTESKMKQLKAATTKLAIEFGEYLVPALQSGVNIFGGIVEWLGSLDDETRKTVVTIGMIAAALPPLLILAGKVVTAIKTIKTAMAGMGGVVGIVLTLLPAVIQLGSAFINTGKSSKDLLSDLTDVEQKILDTSNRTKELTQDAQNLSKAIDDSQKSRRASSEDILAQAETSKSLVEELKELQSKTNLTATEELRRKVIIEQLNSAVDGLNLKMDETTGHLNMNTDAIDENIDAMYRQARMEAAREDYNSIIAEQYEIEKQLYILRQQQAEQEKAKEAAWESFWEAVEKNRFAASENSEESKRVREAEAQYNATADAIKGLEKRYSELGNELVVTNSYIVNNTDSFSENSYAIDSASQSVDGYSESLENASQVTYQFSEFAQELLINLKGTVQDSIESQISLFDKFDGKMTISSKNLLNNMKSQIEGVENWSNNIKSLAERGIDEGLLRYLAEMGPKGAGYVQAFVKMTDEQLAEAGDLYQKSLIIPEETAAEIIDSYASLAKDSVDGFIVAQKEAIEGSTSEKSQFSDQAAIMYSSAFDFESERLRTVKSEAGKSYTAGVADILETPIESGVAENSGEELATTVLNGFALAANGLIGLVQESEEGVITTASENSISTVEDSGVLMANTYVDAFMQQITSRSSEVEEFMKMQTNKWVSSYGGYSASYTQIHGSHKNGLDYVPFDGYVAELHKGERVLTKEEASGYRNSGNSGDTFIFNSPKAIDEYEAARQLRKTKKELEWIV